MRHIKRTIAALLTAALISGCTGCSGSPAPSEPEPYTPDLTPAYEEGCVTPPFWVVRDEDTGAQMFLMGSMHAGTEDVKYPEYILQAYRSSSYIAPEMDTVAFRGDMSLQRKCAGYVKLKDGSTAGCMGADYDRTLEFFKQKGLYSSGMDKMIPYYWASAASGLITQTAGLDSKFGSESILLKLAHGEGKTIREIEGGEAQYKLMKDIPMSVQLDLLKQCVGDENITAQAESSKELYEAWSSFDSEYFSRLTVYDEGAVTASADWQCYYDMMYTRRQELMADFISDGLKAGDHGFVFVGTMHFYAEPSVLTLLEEEGYVIEEIRPQQPVTEEQPAA